MESLPSWDLCDLYQDRDDAKLVNDLEVSKREARAFLEDFQGNLLPINLLAAIQRYELISERFRRLASYAYLWYATDLENPEVLKFFQGIQEKVTEIAADLVFFTLELNDMDEALLTEAYKDSSLQQYQSWIERVRLFRPYLLSKELEQFIHEKSVTGTAAWIRLHDETLARSRFTLAGQRVSLSEILDDMSDKDPERRRHAAASLSEGLAEQLPVLTLIMNTIVKDKAIEDDWRKYPHPVAYRNLENQIDDAAVEALVAAVKESYPRLSHRYYAWKAKFLGQKQLDYWDRNAPLSQEQQKNTPWSEAKEKVLKAYRAFSPQLADIANQFFEQSWIDAAPKRGKQSGAFAHPTVPSVHPYILMNYYGKTNDIMTLAHELGHGIHQILAGTQGTLLSDTPLTLAETASVFGEMLTFHTLLKETKDVGERRLLLAKKIEDMLNTVVRQVAFFDFEKKVHQRRKEAELTAEEFADIWLETQAEALGPAVRLDPMIRPYWSYISHFVHSPFYVYAYAFGCCLVNSLYAVYQAGYPHFHEAYLDLLKAGGSQSYLDLLKPFDMDVHSPQFWQEGLCVITQYIDELEAL